MSYIYVIPVWIMLETQLSKKQRMYGVGPVHFQAFSAMNQESALKQHKNMHKCTNVPF